MMYMLWAVASPNADYRFSEVILPIDSAILYAKTSIFLIKIDYV